MADEYEEVKGTASVPQASGLVGFLRTIESIMKLPRVQEININGKGEVTFRYFLKSGEEARTLDVELESVMPASVIRNSKLEELPNPAALAPMALCQLFDLMARDRLYPVAFVVGPNTCLWDWYTQTAGFIPVRRDELHGVPLLVERSYEEQTLVLCASYTRSAALIDTQSSYKLVIPKVLKTLKVPT